MICVQVPATGGPRWRPRLDRRFLEELLGEHDL